MLNICGVLDTSWILIQETRCTGNRSFLHEIKDCLNWNCLKSLKILLYMCAFVCIVCVFICMYCAYLNVTVTVGNRQSKKKGYIKYASELIFICHFTVCLKREGIRVRFLYLSSFLFNCCIFLSLED